MGVIIPQVVTEDRASGAQVVDGSLRIDKDRLQNLRRDFSLPGNRRTWTWSVWIKRSDIAHSGMMTAAYTDASNRFYMAFYPEYILMFGRVGGSDSFEINTIPRYRDTSSWYHFVFVVDTTQTNTADRVKIYRNNILQSYTTTTAPALNVQPYFNTNSTHRVGGYDGSSSNSNLLMTNVYFVDGRALDPSYFGYTDPLTNTWRPKKFDIRAENNPNNGTTWSNSVSGTADSGWDKTNSFLGRVGNSSRAATGQSLTFTPPSVIPVNTSLRIYARQYGAPGSSVLTVNGTNYASLLTSSEAWITVPETSITSIVWSNVSGNSDSVDVGAIEVDGYFLIDGAGDNSFYLPMDGNSPIGEDKSGRGNNWTPVNFGGSNTIEKATGALPILNTDGGGKTARPGTRTDAYASDIVMAIPFLGTVNDISADIKGSGSNLAVAVAGVPSADNDPTQWYSNSINVSTSNYIDTIGTTSTFAFLHQPESAGTIEGWVNTNAVNVQGPWFQTSNGTDQVGVMFRQNSTTNLSVQINRGVSGVPIVIDSSITVALNTWYHWAFVKSADGYAQFFLNGVPTGSKVPISTAAGAVNAASTNTSSSFAGRIAKNNGEARGVGLNICDYRAYTIQKYAFDTPFIPASTDPDILPDTPSGVAGGSALTKIIDGAVAFDGSGDFLQVPASEDLNVGSADFTAEAWVYPTQYGEIVGAFNLNSPFNGWLWSLSFGSAGKQMIWFDGNQQESTTVVPLNKWSHIAFSKSGTTVRYFLDGKLDGSFTASADSTWSNQAVNIGADSNSTTAPGRNYGGFISNLRLIKGTALYTSNFTPPTEPLTNVTNTKLLCCQSTTSATAAAVAPGSITANGNAAATNFNPFTTDINAVRGQETGYATLNPIDPRNLTNGPTYTLSNGNLTCYMVGGNTNSSENRGLCVSTIDIPTGKKWYCEITTEYMQNDDFALGIASDIVKGYYKLSGGKPGAYLLRQNGQLYHPTGQTGASSSRQYNSGDVIGLAVDLESSTKTIIWYKNNIQLHSFTIDESEGPFKFAAGTDAGGSTGTYRIHTNFGQKPFKFPPPDGFQPLNASTVRPSTVIARPDKYFGTAIYSGTSSGGTTVQSENINFTPDLVWVKARNANENHMLYDSVRGYTKRLSTNNASQEATTNPASDLSGFIRGGYTVGGQNGHINYTGYNYVTWAWKAGGGSGSGGEFWKDDVQYANAAALNMNVGGQNSSVYNMSETWSNDLSATDPSFPAVDGFDGDLTTSARAQATAGTLTWTPTGGLAYTSSVRVYMSNTNYLGETLNLSLNGGTNVPVPSVGWYTLATGSGTITTISSSYTATYKGVFSAIEVDGKILVDSGATPTTQYPSIALTGASVGTKQGFSIVTYTANLAEGGATIAHGLTQEPDFAIFKNRDSTLGVNEVDWGVYHRSIGATKKLELNQALISETHTGPFNNTEPTSSLFYFGGKSGGSIQGHSYLTNGPANDGFVGYIWHDVPGLQKFGSYIGNGGSQFIELGFRPKMLIIKQATGTGYYWNIYDTERDPHNVCTLLLYPNTSNGDDTWAYVDILSNGFRPVVAGNLNELNSQVVYAAWAEAPTFNLYGAQSNAR